MKNEDSYQFEHFANVPATYQEILIKGLSDFALKEKGFSSMQSFSIFIKDQKKSVIGGVSGVIFYQSLYIDTLWVNELHRHEGLGTQLIKKVEQIGKENGVLFLTVNTMDWEGLDFYKKFGFIVEFVREGYKDNSKMFMLRKQL